MSFLSREKELSPYAPRIISMHIDPEQIRTVIGPGGKTINKIIADTGVKIDIDDTGLVYIAAPDVKKCRSRNEGNRAPYKRSGAG